MPPPAALKPDDIPPALGPTNEPGGYDVYGPRVPAVVVSAYAKPNAVTNVVHDHTSILATIEAKWNLPALTFRDANAATLVDFLDLSHAAFMEPPTLAAPQSAAADDASCSDADPRLTVHPNPPAATKRRRRHHHHRHRRRHRKHRRHHRPESAT